MKSRSTLVMFSGGEEVGRVIVGQNGRRRHRAHVQGRRVVVDAWVQAGPKATAFGPVAAVSLPTHEGPNFFSRTGVRAGRVGEARFDTRRHQSVARTPAHAFEALQPLARIATGRAGEVQSGIEGCDRRISDSDRSVQFGAE